MVSLIADDVMQAVLTQATGLAEVPTLGVSSSAHSSGSVTTHRSQVSERSRGDPSRHSPGPVLPPTRAAIRCAKCSSTF